MKKEEYFAQILQILNQDYEKYQQSLNEASKKSIRFVCDAHKDKSVLKNIPFNMKKNPIFDNCFYIENEEKAGSVWQHHAGVFYVQEPAACVPVFAINEDLKGKIVVDCCASPGGKTTQLAELVGEDGFVVSNEYVSKRVNILRGNIERLGFKNVAVVSNDTKKLGDVLCGVADVVVVDAPCSGEGMFRKNPETMNEWTLGVVDMCAERQFQILQNVCKIVKNKGKMVYSTCTFNKKENEGVVEQFLKLHKDFKLIELSNDIQSVSKPGICDTEDKYNLKFCRRFYPHDNFGEGQFVAVMQRVDEEEFSESVVKIKKEKLQAKEEFLVKSFIDKNFDLKKYDIAKLGSQFFILPKNRVDLKGLSVAMLGVCAGEIENQRFVPHHHLFKAFAKNCFNVVDLKEDKTRINKFIAGDQIFDEKVEDGYCAILSGGFALGFGKAKNGTINNHYPKGLRQILS